MRKETEKEKEKGINYDTDSPFPLTEKMARENMGKNYKPSKKTLRKRARNEPKSLHVKWQALFY